jgi:hypothetical protein
MNEIFDMLPVRIVK